MAPMAPVVPVAPVPGRSSRSGPLREAALKTRTHAEHMHALRHGQLVTGVEDVRYQNEDIRISLSKYQKDEAVEINLRAEE